MDRRPDFASDLSAVQSEIANDVGSILEVVKARRASSNKRLAPVNSAEANEDNSSQESPITETEKPPRSRRPQTRAKEDRESSIVLENVTTRLHRETNALLTEASLHQRLKKLTPATRQGIIEVALQEWLRRNEYIR